ncbi:MAG TPA: sigma-54 dependent transcriptional regulator [Thermoanaerobaculia bacterium]|nr:sigma-54 dependent transcriptional regulator [Thermoanaerobaculia bacterium]
MRRILIIDDEPSIRDTLRDILVDEGHRCTLAESAEEGLAAYAKEDFDLILLDVWLPGMDGLALLERFRSAGSMPPVIVISGHGSVETAVRATRLGAYDFLEKPLSLERVLLTVGHALADRALRQQVRDLRRTPQSDEILIGESEAVQQLEQQVRNASRSGARVLLTGENGSGKEVVARMLHRDSPRADHPFIAVNCAAIPDELIESELFGHQRGAFTGANEDRKGKFELADGGTLLLDEVGDMSLRTQAKVLRVLETQQFQRVGGQQTIEVDVRVVAATNKELEDEIAAHRFREDLYFRLNVIPIRVPPLRERGRDVLLLADHFLRRFAAETGQRPKRLGADAERKLLAYSWPGNVRELRNLMERLTILAPGETVDPDALVLGGRTVAALPDLDRLPLRDAREQFERAFILRRLREYGGNVSRAAEALGVERSNLYRKLHAYGIRVERK